MNNKKTATAILGFVAGMSLVACGGGGNSGKTYTYNTYLSTSPTNWNVHNWETSDESYITSFTEMGLYDCILDEKKTGYEFVPEMAEEFPIAVDSADLTDEEIDTYYSKIGNPPSGVVWDIKLNKNAVWEDGRAIKADEYVQSMERQLNNKLVNYRADSYYNGSLVIANAETYYKQGRQTTEPAFNYLNADTGEVPDDTGYWYMSLSAKTPYADSVFSGLDEESENLYTVLNQRSSKASDPVELAATRVNLGYAYYIWQYTSHENSSHKDSWDKVKSPKDVSKDMIMEFPNYVDYQEFSNNDVYVPRTSDTTWVDEDEDGIPDNEDKWELWSEKAAQKDLQTFVAGIGRGTQYAKTWSWKYASFTLITTVNPEDEVKFEEVGIKARDEYTIRLYLSKSITNLNLKFALCGNWLVNIPLYDKLNVYVGGELKGTKYATDSAANYMSYGPYKLTNFEAGKLINIERNDKWYGYKDGKHEKQFQMDAIKTTIIKDHGTAMGEFEKGKLDDIDLNVNDMRKYGSSGRRSTTYESYTQKISFNTKRSKLLERQGGEANVNKTALANIEFRTGLSLALDRNDFARAATSGSKGFTGLLNDLYLSQVSTGEAYRNTKQGKSVYNAVYGDKGGTKPGETTESGENIPLDESKCGYNKALAVNYVADGLQAELTSSDTGHLQAGNKIDIEFRVYDSESENTIAAFNFLNTAWTGILNEACDVLRTRGVLGADENIELNLHMVKDEDYYDSAKNGNYDMIFSIWGGAAINPTGLMEVYCKADFVSCCEFGFKGQQNSVVLPIDQNGDGTVDPDTEIKSYDAWYQLLEGDSTPLNEGVFGDELQPGDKDYEAWKNIHEQRMNILAGLEAGIINRFEAIPLVARGTSSLLGFKVENATDTYVSLIGYGGIRFMTFNYDDAAWDKFCAEHNNNLSELYQTYEG
ncbi:MAG: ABC transporter substrate-binding protein [Bacilli bacterium]|nr:ABC transporter substrate-binding protein [Bacilli bacterium]